MAEMENEVAALRAKVAEMEAQLAARDAEIAQLKGEGKVERVWVYAHGFDNEFYFETEEEADEWWEWYKTETDDDVEGQIEQVWKHDADFQARFAAKFLCNESSESQKRVIRRSVSVSTPLAACFWKSGITLPRLPITLP